MYLGEELNSAVKGADSVVVTLVLVGEIGNCVVVDIIAVVDEDSVVVIAVVVPIVDKDNVFGAKPPTFDDDVGKSVLWMEASEDGVPGVAANNHSHNHGQASSARSFILLIVSLAHRRWNSYNDVYVVLPRR